MLSEDISQRNLNFESYKERITNFSNEFELGLFLYIVRRSLLWIVLSILLALASAFLYLRYTAPTYESRTILQLRESNTAQQILNVESFVEDKNLQADVELMRSRFFISKALDRMPLEVSYFNRGQILTEEFYTNSFFNVKELSILNERVLDIPIQLDLNEPGSVSIAYAVAEKSFSFTFAVNEIIRTPHFSCVLDLSKRKPQGKASEDQYLFMKFNSRKALITRYSRQISVRIADGNAQTVEVTAMDENPFLARDLAQAMAETFIAYDVERKTESAESIIRFIRAQKDTVFEQLRSSEYKLQDFKIENKVANLEQLTPMYLDQSKRYEEEVVKIAMDIALLKEIGNATDKPLPEINVYDLMPLLVGTEYHQTLSSMIRTMEDLLAQRDAIYLEATEKHQAVISLEYQIGVQKRMILESINTLLGRAERRMVDLNEHLRQFEMKFMTLPEKELQYARIERIFNINEKYYTQLLEKDIEYRISKAGFVPENQILEEAEHPSSPLTPKKDIVLLSYILAGVVMSFVIVLVRYILHDNITSLHDISKLAHASIGILGMIPKYKKDIPISQLLIDKNPKSLIAESFRSIRTNLQFVDNSPGPKTIAVTSTISGEGKTFVAINLAGIISFSGKRVIILDLDMRKPKIHLGFGVENISGMSTLLIGKDTMDNCIQHSNLEGLDFITAGPIPPNPSELIIHPRMQQVIDELKRKYDVVLIDNPPVGLVTDGIPMIQLADYPIYIFRSDYSKKQFVQNVDRLINENNITRLSAILNGVDVDRNKYGYNYGYGYGYGYGQGYGGGYYEDRNSKAKTGFFNWLLGRS